MTIFSFQITIISNVLSIIDCFPIYYILLKNIMDMDI